MAAPADLPLADTSDMIGLHRVFREAVTAAPSLVGGVDDSDAARAEVIASYYPNVLDLLDGHHEGEDLLLTPRLGEEEREILLIAARCVNVAEWGQLPEHGMKSFRGDKLWLIIGLVQEQMTPEQRAMMQARMPSRLLEFWNGPGHEQFASFIADLRR